MKKVGVGVIGMGRFGELHAATYKKMDSANLVAVSTRNPARLDQVRGTYGVDGYTDYHDLLRDQRVEAVSISIPPNAQKQIAVDAMKAGKHVLLEKPIAITLEDAQEIVAVARETGMVAMVGYVERFNASLRRTKALIKAGRVGDVCKVSSRRASRFKGKPDWVFAEVGMMIHIIGHDLDILRWMMDDEITQVFTMSGSYLRNVPGQPDNLNILFRFKRGGMGLIESSWTLPSKYPVEENDTRVDIMGTQGVLKVNNFDQTIAMCNEEVGYWVPGILRWPGSVSEDGGLEHYAMKDELEHFVKAVRGLAPPIVSAEEAAYILKVLLAANESERTGLPVNID